ncbi:MAG: hypothetical protein RR712_04365 [Terrisporobacter sp.]
MNNITEQDLIDFLKTILRVEDQISLQDFKQRVREAFRLSEHDLSISTTRPNEMMYEQKCRNINCHRSFPSELIIYENQVFYLR